MDFQIRFSEDLKTMKVDIRGFALEADNSVVKGGAGNAPNPGTYLYTAVGSCVAATAFSYCFRNLVAIPNGSGCACYRRARPRWTREADIHDTSSR